MPEIHTFPLQPGTKKLAVKQVADGWIVFIAGQPNSNLCNYIYLHTDGSIDRVSEQPDRMHVVTIKDAGNV